MAKVLAILALCLATSLAVPAVTILATVRDFNTGFPDFETFNVAQTGAVETLLDFDGKPVLAAASSYLAFSNPTWFADWYRDIENINIPFTFNFPMTQNGGTYSYDNDAFFPIDGMGWGNYQLTGHNFHFTTEFNLFFTYNGGETFAFTTANDMWVFVNNVLVVDLGGVNSEATASLIVDDLGLTIGQNYEIDIFHAQRHTPNSILHIDTTAVLGSFPSDEPVAIPGVDVYICEVLLQNYCPGAPVDYNNITGGLDSGSTGNAGSGIGDSTGSNSGANSGSTTGDYDNGEGIPSKRDTDSTTCSANFPAFTFVAGGSSYGMDNFNVISFDSFYADSGDIEGRLAVRNTLNLNSGQFSVGYQLRTGGVTGWDLSLPYSVVVGGDATWVSGAVYPDGTNDPYNGAEEGIFVGGTFTASADLTARRTGGPCAVSGCLDSQFDSAQAFFTNLQNDFSLIADNVDVEFEYSGMTITCADATAESYSMTVDGASFSQITYFTINNCNRNAQIVINIIGTSDVRFYGSQIDHDSEKVLYNILGSDRVIEIQTSVAGSILAPNNQYKQPDMGVVIGNVIVGNIQQALQINRVHCLNPAPTPHNPSNDSLCPTFEQDCLGLDFPLQNGVYSFREFNVITFGSFVASTGDIEGRLAAQVDVTLGAGYSIGYELQTSNNQPDAYVPYSLVVGRNLNWISGSLSPDGTGLPYPGEAENMFVGGTASVESDLVSRVMGPCASPGCLDMYFDAAQQCYEGYQSALASQADNVDQEVEYDGLFLTCDDSTADVYFVTIHASTFSSFTYTSVSNCNFQAFWIINIDGTDDVTISGDSFPAICGGVVYNVQGSGRTITVTETSVCGHILAPQNTLYQKDGVIVGKVVAGDITFALQINKQNNCPNPGTVNLPTATSTDSGSTATYLQVKNTGGLQAGDTINFNGLSMTNQVASIAGNTIYLATPLASAIPEGSVIYATVSNAYGRPISSSDVSSPSSSSTVSVIVSLLFALIVLAF